MIRLSSTNHLYRKVCWFAASLQTVIETSAAMADADGNAFTVTDMFSFSDIVNDAVISLVDELPDLRLMSYLIPGRS